MKTSKSPSTSKKSNNPAPDELYPNEPLDWQAVMHEWEASDLSQPEFCKAKSLNYTTFVYQRNKFKKNKNVAPPLLPIKLLQPAQTSAPLPLATCFILQWPSGIKLSIPPQADATILKALLTCLELS